MKYKYINKITIEALHEFPIQPSIGRESDDLHWSPNPEFMLTISDINLEHWRVSFAYAYAERYQKLVDIVVKKRQKQY